jgi:hypothetical protein
MEEVFYGKRLSTSSIPTVNSPNTLPRNTDRASVARTGKKGENEHVAMNPSQHSANLKKKRVKTKPEQR